MIEINETKIFDAIFEFLNETLDEQKANDQATTMVSNIKDQIIAIDIMVKTPGSNNNILSNKFHTLKNLLLYGDFYYESDLCQDIEIELRKNKSITSIISIYETLIDSLKM